MTTATADELREQASRHYLAAEESFDRCDTDGFLSQWAHGLNAQLCQAKADIAEDGGMADFEVLLEGERRVDAKLIDGQYGACWLLSDEEAERFGRRFIPFAGKGKSRVHKQLGLHEGTEKAPAAAKITGRGTGIYEYNI
jgi:hypothetical protein